MTEKQLLKKISLAQIASVLEERASFSKEGIRYRSASPLPKLFHSVYGGSFFYHRNPNDKSWRNYHGGRKRGEWRLRRCASFYMLTRLRPFLVWRRAEVDRLLKGWRKAGF
jgi:hypothetical protein